MVRQIVHIRSDPSIGIVGCARGAKGLILLRDGENGNDVEGLVVRPLRPDVHGKLAFLNAAEHGRPQSV
jgi:hypothetical protein